MPRGIAIVRHITDEQLLDMHWKQNKTPREIAIALGYSFGAAQAAIHQEFKRRGLPLRSRSEAIKLRYKLKPETFSINKRRGEKHYKWKGGRLIRCGYVHIRKPDHHRADATGYVLEHILIWEEFHHKRVPEGYIIHHLNGIKDDNRPENLMAVSRSKHEHRTFVKTLQARIRELEQLHLPL